MIIDFHTHIFPDNLAARAMETLLLGCNNLYKNSHDGTLSGLLKTMDDWGIDISVIQPVVTKQSQVKPVNDWAAGICSERITAFGGIYPHSEDYKRDIDYVVSLGLKGLKFHAEYQNFVIDDAKMLKIYDYALSKGLILLHHAGFDPAFPPPFKSSPQKFAEISKEMRGGVIVAAHLGGQNQWEDVERYMAGSGIYLDTSMGFDYYSKKQFLSIAKKHGTDKILFASDSPWSSAKSEMENIKSLFIPENEIKNILGKNAKRILGI